MRRSWRLGAERAALFVAAGLGLCAAGCSSESEKAPGVLMLALTTDLEVPKDFDQVLVKVQSDESKEPKCKLLSWSGSEAGPATQVTSECTGETDATELKLPATVGIESRKTNDATVTVTALRGSESVFCQSFKANGLPTAGDGTVPMKRVDVSWLETKEAGESGSCSETDKLSVSALPEFSKKAIFGGDEGECFDTLKSAQSARALTFSRDDCSLSDVDIGSSLLLVKPAGTMGICGRAVCFVPVDAETVVGTSDRICEQVESGAIRAVLAVAPDAAQTESMPTCGSWSSVTSEPGTVEDPFPFGRELLAYWSIDEGKGAKWLDETFQGRDLEPGGGKNAEPPKYVDTRVGGRGKAALLTGTEYMELTDPRPLETQAFSLSAWVSFGPDDIKACSEATQPLISTRSGCGGYELGLRCSKEAGGTRPSAVFAYGCDGQGKPEELVAPLPKNSGQWTPGDWYHVAATYSYDEATGGHAALFLDGVAAAETSGTAKLSFSGDAPFDVGKGFHGYVDDVLVFGRALDGETIHRLYETSATVQGPSGMRWGTWDATGSVASLGEQSGQRDLRVDVAEAAECSSGGAIAHLSDTQLEQLAYGAARAVLDADITSAVDDPPPWFEFSLSGPHGRPQCTWYGVVDASGHYEFDLKRPNWCANSDACAIDPSSVRTATISTHWKNIDPLALSIKSLEFRPGSAEWSWNSADEDKQPGDVSLCWRPVTYEPTPVALALWSTKSAGGAAWDDPKWPVLLAGESDNSNSKGSTAEVAGFVAGGLPLDLTNCDSIDVTLEPNPTDKNIEITIEDATGTACQHTLDSSPISFPANWVCNACAAKDALDLASVRAATTRIAVRKTWGTSVKLKEPIELNSVKISFPSGCAVPAK